MYHLHKSSLLSGMHQIQAHPPWSPVCSFNWYSLGKRVKWKKMGKRAVAKEELSHTLSYIDLLSYLPNNVDIHRGSLSQAFFHNYKANWCQTDRSGLLRSTAIWWSQPAPSRQASLSRCVSNDAIDCGAADHQPFLCRWNASLPQKGSSRCERFRFL